MGHYQCGGVSAPNAAADFDRKSSTNIAGIMLMSKPPMVGTTLLNIIMYGSVINFSILRNGNCLDNCGNHDSAALVLKGHPNSKVQQDIRPAISMRW